MAPICDPLRHDTIASIISDRPDAPAVFRRYGIDYYRIGTLELVDAAERQGVSVDTLMEDLSALPLCVHTIPQRCKELIAYIRKHYGCAYRNQMHTALRLARLAESACARQEGFPHGLSSRLAALDESLGAHIHREEEVLFPAMLTRPRHHLRFPVLRAIMEHDDLSDQLDTLARMCSDYSLPPQTGRGHDDPEGREAWRALYAVMARLDATLRFQMHLENNRLFPRFVEDRSAA